MSGFQASDTMPKLGHVTDLREQWLVRADGALAHRLQDREISSHLCENRYRNQQIREDFPVALHEQRGIDHERRMRDLALRRQAEIDAEIAREMAEINLRRQRRQHSNDLVQPCSSRAAPPAPPPPDPVNLPTDIDPEQLGLSPAELEEMRRRLEQEERDARLARELSHEVQGQDALLADMKCAVEAQDGELARLLQEREYKKLQRAKEKARQKALLKKQQRMAQQQNELPQTPQATLCDAYSNPRENRLRLCKSVDSDLNYVEPFEKEHIQSKASALQSKEISKQYYSQEPEPSTSRTNINNISHGHSRSFDSDKPSLPSANSMSSIQHRQPPLPPTTGKKPRFPDPISIRPASHYPTDNVLPHNDNPSIPHSYSDNNNLYSSTFPPDHGSPQRGLDRPDSSKRLSVISDITAEGLAKKKNKQEQKKRKGCKIQ
ncbi:coiled-coil domain-containing protein 50 [Pectinophora gossypiella]|uniref:coiled-coil domain-containing protein 50 n=1 Tax=Pectinophora gossypiella TaxID=13191 RepID=UPI00214F31A2|nr:coiled-coil domain-containing protein 50 [Pectinophora gossypiella]